MELLNMEGRKHGIGGYNFGCRCEICREAKRIKRAEYQSANAAANAKRRAAAARATPEAKARKKQYDQDYRAKTYDSTVEHWRSMQKKWGITEALYNQLLASQNGGCAICDTPPKTWLAIDHDHSCCPGQSSCGKCIRGLLCFGCNAMLGRLRDNPSRLVAYLERGPLT